MSNLDTLMKGHDLGIHDRRRKLTDKNKEEIRDMHKRGFGVREIARAFDGTCSRRLIQFVLFPERLKQLQQRNREQEHWKKYHNRQQLTTATRNWRRYKKRLYKEGKLKVNA